MNRPTTNSVSIGSKSVVLALLLTGCVVRETERVRVQFRTLPPKVIEKVILIVPKEAVPPKEPEWKKRENLA
jgi:hypothetical protein